MLQLVAAGVGVAPVPETFRRLFAIDVEYRPINLPKSPLNLYIAWRKDNESHTLTEFIKMLRIQVGEETPS
jgi:DNA-binding transcriptional LysR family regulator